MSHFQADMVARSHDEIEDMCKEMRDSHTAGGKHYEDHSYEEGVLAAVKWIFFKSGEHPCDIGKRNLDDVARRTQLEILQQNHAQTREGSDA